LSRWKEAILTPNPRNNATARPDTSHIGHVAQLRIMADLAEEHHFFCDNAFESLPFDFYAMRSGETLRVQAKTARHRTKDGRDYIVITATRNDGERYTAQEIDLIAAWDFEEGRAYYVPVERLNGRGEVWIDKRKLYRF
jgi:hypothetical protein